jgi:excisionase family DNA binding protein
MSRGKCKDQPQRRLLDIKQAAHYLGATEWAVRDLIWSGKLPVVKWGRGRNAKQYIDLKDIDAFIEGHKEHGVAELSGE